MNWKIFFLTLSILGTIFFLKNRYKQDYITPKSEAPIIKIGISPDYPPFEFKDEQGKIIGFDIDVIDAIMRHLKLPYELVIMPFESLMPAVQIGSIALIISGLTATVEREKQLILSQPYTPQEFLAVIHMDSSWNPRSIDDLVHKKIIVNYGYIADSLLQEKYPHIEAIRTPAPAEALMALRYNKGDAFLIGEYAAKKLLDTIKQSDGLNMSILSYPVPGMVMGISKHHNWLASKINTTIEELKTSGVLEKIQHKWSL